MKSGKLLLAIVALLLIADIPSFAQNAGAMRRKDSRALSRTTGEQRLSVGLSLGTTGVGVEARAILNHRWNMRLGASMLPLTYSRTFDNATGKAQANFGNIHLLGELKFGSQFRLVGGMAFFFQQGVIAEGRLIDGVHYADIDLKSQEVSKLEVGIEWKRICPYIGIGLLRDMPVGKFNVNVDLGTYYMSMPTSKWEASDPSVQANLIEYKKTLDGYISGYRWYPVLQFNFNYLVK